MDMRAPFSVRTGDQFWESVSRQIAPWEYEQ